MHCASCVRRVEEAILAVPGVVEASVNLVEKSASVTGGDPEVVAAAVQLAGYGARVTAAAATDSAYEIDILGMHCASCVRRVEQALLAVPGVVEAAVNLVEKTARVRGGDPEAAVQAVLAQGYGASLPAPATDLSFFLRLEAPPETDDVEQITDVLQARDGAAELRFEDGRLRVSTAEHPADVLLRLNDLGYQATLEETYADPAVEQAGEARREIRRSWQRAIVAGVVGFGLMAGEMSGLFPHLHQNPGFWAGAALVCLVTMYFCGRNYFIGAWKQARHGAANMDTLVALGTGAAWLSSVLVIAFPRFFPGAGHLYLDASVMILGFLQLGHALETRAKRTTSEAISALIGLRATTAQVTRSAGQVTMPVSLLRVGDLVRVRPGEKVPIDGVITEGRTTIDESMLTGEPLSVAREVGDTVTGGTMNRSGAFVLRVSRLGEETTLARIIRMVRSAQISKPPIGRLVDRIASVFVPIVIVIAATTFAFWLFMGPEPRLAFALTTAIAVLVIACPCALGLATPIAIMVGTSRAAQANVLIRNSDALQSASRLTHIVVDKTGTLTEGRPAVTAIRPAGACAACTRAAPTCSAVTASWSKRGWTCRRSYVPRPSVRPSSAARRSGWPAKARSWGCLCSKTRSGPTRRPPSAPSSGGASPWSCAPATTTPLQQRWPARWASTRCTARFYPKPSWRWCRNCRPAGSGLVWSATGSTTPRPWPRRTPALPWAAARTWPSRTRTSP